MAVKEEVSLPTQRICTRCKFVSSQEVCKACVLLEGLNKGLPKLGIGKSSKAKKMLEEYNANQNSTKKAIDEINVDCQKNNCVSRGKVCRSNRDTTNDNKVNSRNGEKCCSTQEKTNDSATISNTKLNTLLQDYGIPENDCGDDINTSIGESSENHNFEVDLHNEDVTSLAEDTDACVGACGKMDSMHIGF